MQHVIFAHISECVSACVRVHVCECVCMWLRVCAHGNTHTHTHTHTRTHTHTHTQEPVYSENNVYVCVCVCIYNRTHNKTEAGYCEKEARIGFHVPPFISVRWGYIHVCVCMCVCVCVCVCVLCTWIYLMPPILSRVALYWIVVYWLMWQVPHLHMHVMAPVRLMSPLRRAKYVGIFFYYFFTKTYSCDSSK